MHRHLLFGFLPFFVMAAGCEILATVDRSQIPGTGGLGTGGEGGNPTAGGMGGNPTAGGMGGMGGNVGGAGGTGGSVGGAGGTGGQGGAGVGGTGGQGGAGVGGTGGMGVGGAGVGGAGVGGMGVGGAGVGGAGVGGSGGAGGNGGCAVPGDCPDPMNECLSRTCIANVCGTANVAAGTPTTVQTAGDCQEIQCDGAGSSHSVAKDTDLPVDNNLCTQDICTAGVPSNPNEIAGHSCGGISVCDGMGNCVGCVLPTDCPGTDDDCKTRTCTLGVCGFNFANAGTPTSIQVNGDCMQNQCDGNGNSAPVVFDTDVPVDGNQCTDDVCTTGVPSNPNSTIGTACNAGGGQKCDGAGNCVECVVAGDCASGVCTGFVCQAPTCMDTVKNGAETDVDCGGGTCPACPDLKGCSLNTDCTNGSCLGGFCQVLWINELHYDNTGADVNEGVEIAGTAGADLTGWTIVLYNGTGGATYLPLVNLSGVIPNQQANKGTLFFAAAGMQNGGAATGTPDGLALVTPGNVVVQFLSYEGAFMATNGPAMGSTSIDIGVFELGTEPVGQSLQLSGTGSKYSDFTWQSDTAATSGMINNGQTFN